MKKCGLLMFLVLFLLSLGSAGKAEASGAKIYLDGEQLNLPSGVKVLNVNNSIMVPIRVVSENLGYEVKWEKSTQTVSVLDSVTAVHMNVGKTQSQVNGIEVQMSIPPMLQGGTTLVPLRFVSTEMGMDIEWDNQIKAVYLTSSAPPVATEPVQVSPPPAGSVGSNPGAVSPVEEVTPVSALASVDGISFVDNQLLIAVSGKVTPKVFSIPSPDRIVVDLPQSFLSSSFAGSDQQVGKETILPLEGYPDVKQIRYARFSASPETVRVVLDLHTSKAYELTHQNGLITLNLNIEQTAAPAEPASSGKKIVVIDAGHGDGDPGAPSVNKRWEKDFNLAVAQKVGKLLEKETQIEVVLTRSNDTFLELKDRVKIANNLKADVFVSIHGNSNNSSSANGTETFYTRDASLSFAKIMHSHLSKATGLKNRGVSYGNFHVTRETSMPAVLLEIGFLSNKGDETQMFKEDFQNRVAQSIVDGIKEYLKVQ
ncbi:N-acetylmuramoyl-L-alanine amidase [Paenibacillus sp. F411]|uniref:N-acetylmuramoyl-L-alanine amidase family protein n=1 Tax=Paenibacillus sp. F411 TaxID=2820239 RepID=UPI001AAE2FA2|nr:N-acetylmuramoyl-L-alanine amidase family protein [Paenibacillus sp. F411]MBO2943118.1 N-acetylmuramoyl-L-alanine amidase [Paenibacillus sp. F411]